MAFFSFFGACLHFVLISENNNSAVTKLTHLVRVSFGDPRYRAVVPDIVQLRGRDESVVLNSPYRRLHVEGVAPGKPDQLRVTGHPVIGRSLQGAGRRIPARARQVQTKRNFSSTEEERWGEKEMRWQWTVEVSCVSCVHAPHESYNRKATEMFVVVGVRLQGSSGVADPENCVPL